MDTVSQEIWGGMLWLYISILYLKELLKNIPYNHSNRNWILTYFLYQHHSNSTVNSLNLTSSH